MIKNIFVILLLLGLTGCETMPLENIAPTVPSLTRASGGTPHRVQVGQTLWKISKVYNVDIDEILSLNHLTEESSIEVGQMLLIPEHSKMQSLSIKIDGGDFIWPLKGRIISNFGANFRNLVNKGINIQAVNGADVVASRSGRVVFLASNLGNFGKTIIIDHGDGLRSVYSRLAEIFVRSGEEIQKGAIIGKAGSSARDKNIYLHFEIRKGALPQNPLFYLL